MTARARLNRRMRWVGGTMYAGLGLFLAGILLGMAFGRQPILAASLPGFAAAFGSGLVAHFLAFRCPRCRGNLAPWLCSAAGSRWTRGCASARTAGPVWTRNCRRKRP
jgi:hypothetical protein